MKSHSIPAAPGFFAGSVASAVFGRSLRPIPRLADWNPWALAHADGHDPPGLIDELVPSVATVVDDVVDGIEDPV
jgi:hypothetical protein